jgi:SAM-dependent methyltransferase
MREARLSKLTGERPLQGVTPDSLLALHRAGYRAVAERLGPGRLLDVGCGTGLETARLAAPGRPVVGVDYALGALPTAATDVGGAVVGFVAGDAARLGIGTGCVDWVCSSHVVEHFEDPARHLCELARVLRPGGTCFVLTPNAPADFENPFHLHLFVQDSLAGALGTHFDDVWVGGIDASAAVKDDFARRRAKAERLLRFDVLDLRHRMPRSWYVAAYTRLLPLAYRLVARDDSGGATGIGTEDFFVTDAVDPSTPVLFAVARRPRRGGR